MDNFKHIYTLLIVFLCGSSFAQSNADDLSLFILDDAVSDHSIVTAIIKNQSDLTYWLPIDSSELAYNAVLFGDYQSTVYTLAQNVYEEPGHIKTPVVSFIDFNADKVLRKWQSGLVVKRVDDFIVVPPHGFVSVKIPFNLKYKLSPSFYQVNQDATSLSYNLSYSASMSLVKKVLGESFVKKVKDKGYQFYPYALKSNTVPLIVSDPN